MKKLIAVFFLLALAGTARAQSYGGLSSSDVRVQPPYRICVGQDNGSDGCFALKAANQLQVQNADLYDKNGNLLGQGVPVVTVSGLSAHTAQRIAIVTDGSTATDCTIGSGSNTVVCQYSGTSWSAVSSAGTSGVSSFNSRTGAVTPQTGDYTATNVGLGNVTNDAQTKAAVMPNTAPTSGQIPVGNAGGTAYAPVSMSGDCTILSSGAISCVKTGGTAFGTLATIATGTMTDSDYCIYSSTGPTISCNATGSGGGANTALSNLASVSINTSFLAQTGVDLGGTANPFRNLYLFGAGTYGTTYLKLTGTPTSTRTVTFPDATDTVVELTQTQTLTNKTMSGASNTFTNIPLSAFTNLGTTTTVLHGNAAGNPSFGAVTPSDASGNTSGSGNFCLTTNCAMTTPNLGTPSAINLSNATSLPCAAMPALTGGVTSSSGSCATTVAATPVSLDTTTPITVSTTNNSEYYNNQNATAATAVTYNLPTAAAGKQFCFTNSFNGTAADTGVLTVATSASGQFIIFTDGTETATGGNVTSGGAAADAACVVGISSTVWQLYVQRGTWTKH